MSKRPHDERWDAAQEGAELLREGELERAVEELERVIAEDPDNEYAHYFLGSTHFEAGHFGAALKSYVRALEIAPEYEAVFTHLGHTLRMLGRYDEAIRVGQQALARKNEDPDALYLIGLSYHARGDDDEAVAFLSRFLETRPELEIAVEVEALLRGIRGEVSSELSEDEPELN